ncbi:MAG: hypothetical protein H6R18_2584 [Proteobacteria bacterium]|nr:hypothetical protein [Pseudomonadota bacterium]
MPPIHELDALLLMALALSAKRRPAELIEIISAIDFVQAPVPSEIRLIDAFRRLAANALISEAEGCFALTPEAQKIMASLPKKGETAERIASIKEKLSAHYFKDAKEDSAPLVLTTTQLCAAILEHRASSQSKVKNLLMPKPKVAEDERPGVRQRKPAPARRKFGKTS